MSLCKGTANEGLNLPNTSSLQNFAQSLVPRIVETEVRHTDVLPKSMSALFELQTKSAPSPDFQDSPRPHLLL